MAGWSLASKKMNTYSDICAGSSLDGEPCGTVVQSADADLLAQAYEREGARDLRAVAAIVDRLLHDGRCNAALARLFARVGEDLGREGEALGSVLSQLGLFHVTLREAMTRMSYAPASSTRTFPTSSTCSSSGRCFPARE